ncbi:Exopolysaccharide biosynthesis protein [Xenorhabdus poinarii G6]|uniref:Exopolysaccharide biosynthesis protein n=1 Tax=Xenorhabdus poinarii G6 TaxID=1354304 RepID=A0A068QZJ0_9GAMM|nr:DUF1919 domain-containing protein [Xenorhabdus poinarii]CDG20467.1 Exopolysaccharide biosynthesis protein [Xenorhabdus poinarii G6]
MQSYIKYKLHKWARKGSWLSDLLDRMFLRNKKIAIVSDNCWGIRLYKNLNRPYNTPFIGLTIPPDDFLKIISNLEEYLNIELKISDFSNADKFPVAFLSGIRINFIHYKNEEDAIEKWNRRRLRLMSFLNENGIDSIIFKSCHVDSKDDVFVKKFKELDLKRKIFLEKDSIIIKRNGDFPDGLELYEIRLLYYFNFIKLFKYL